MSDPFRFRENKVAWQTDYEGGCRWITAHCDTPTGVISAYGEDLRGVMDELYCEFRASVRNATAHQRLAWMAAAQTEQVAP